MYLRHLSLTNFRNFIRLEMEFPAGPSLVVGPNRHATKDAYPSATGGQG